MRKKTTIAILAVLFTAAASATATGISHGFGRPLRALGIESMECNCSQVMSADDDATLWMFDGEPTINKVDRDGPSAGRLKKGDSIVAIDGYLITTTEGGRRFSRIRPGEAVVLTVRRGRQTRDETIVPSRVSAETPLILGLEDERRGEEARRLAQSVEKLSRISLERTRELQRRAELLSPRRDKLVVSLDELKRLSELDVLRTLDRTGAIDFSDLDRLSHIGDLLYFDDVAPQGSFGFALSFSGRIKTGMGHDPIWHFNELPEIETVDPDSPADKAGLRPGDVLVRIDGVALDSDEGGRRFSEVRPGQSVEWTIRRDGEERTIEATASERTSREGRDDTDAVRYTGSLGDTDIKVEGDRRVRVVEDGDVITIRTGDATIRLSRSGRR